MLLKSTTTTIELKNNDCHNNTHITTVKKNSAMHLFKRLSATDFLQRIYWFHTSLIWCDALHIISKKMNVCYRKSHGNFSWAWSLAD